MDRRGFFGWVVGGVSSWFASKALPVERNKHLKDSLSTEEAKERLIAALRKLGLNGISYTKGEVVYSNPDIVINFNEPHPPLSDAEVERIKREWEESMRGNVNHGKFIVCPSGAKLEKVKGY